MVRFTASIVVVDSSDDEFILVGFADERDGAYGKALPTSGDSHHFDEQDVALGMDRVYTERNSQSQGGYGGVEQIDKLHRGRVRVVIRRELAERMGDDEFEITLALPPEEFARLREGLRVVFAGFGSLVKCPA